ncbi:MAG: TatD family hydrolase [Bacteroidales bacterium]|nr:TatD family hydrolase [Bacteroidales bacterium]
MKYIDIHTHSSFNPNYLQILDYSYRPRSTFQPKAYYSLGLHPWYLKEESLTDDLQLLSDQCQVEKCVAIGECGLDKICSTDFNLQLIAFRQQVELSEFRGKPVIVHAVKASNEILEVRKQSKAKQAWIIHGFNGNGQAATQFIKAGCYLSFGSALVNPNSRASQTLLELDLEQIFFETDTLQLPIEEVYRLAGEKLKIEKSAILERVFPHFHTIFNFS